jgi:hypothetical protein
MISELHILMCKEEEEEVDIKRSPVPLPDNATCTPVLVKVRSPQIIENRNVQANSHFAISI